MEPTYHLEGIIRTKEEMEDFEGPLNLILMLLSKNKIEIRDIQISEILEQYLDYLRRLESMDLEVTSEFIQMAAHLLYIKTKMLLSSQNDTSELELLMASLEQLKAKDIYSGIKETSPFFSGASESGFRFHVKPPEPLMGSREYRYRHEPVELLSALAKVFSRAANTPEEETGGQARRRIVPSRIVYNVRDKSCEIIERFRSIDKISLRKLYMQSHTRSEVVATFISILELCSMGNIQMEPDGEDIILRFMGSDVDSVLDSISE